MSFSPKIGAKYEEENEKDLKDQMDFPSQPNIPSQLSKPVTMTWSIKKVVEFPLPRLGCRVMVQRNFSKILPALLKDLTDWTVNSRTKVQHACVYVYTLNCSITCLGFSVTLYSVVPP